MSHTNIPEIIGTLPVDTRCPPYPIYQYGGFWLPEFSLKGIATSQACFEWRPTDIFLASFPKCGTTWLKALTFATLNRDTHSPSDERHPLRCCNPHDCVNYLEVDQSGGNSNATDFLQVLPSPRLISTHTPYSLLPHSITKEGSGCRLVYLCRDPKDTMVSLWHFNRKTARDLQLAAGLQPFLPTFEEAFKMFCDGRCFAGPQWRHTLEYWEESQRNPSKVLFLRYEEILQDPVGNLKKLAVFMGCAFSAKEEEAGVPQEIVELCSLEKLKSSDVNKKGNTLLGLKKEAFFRNGKVGDWRNHMTPEMAARLDRIVQQALQGSGLTFSNTL